MEKLIIHSVEKKDPERKHYFNICLKGKPLCKLEVLRQNTGRHYSELLIALIEFALEHCEY